MANEKFTNQQEELKEEQLDQVAGGKYIEQDSEYSDGILKR